MNLYAISDLHVGHPANRRVVESIAPHPDDWLIVAGDVGETLEQVSWALATLASRFAKVVWAPGNHELWTLPGRPDQLRGQARYEALVALCRGLGVITPECDYPLWPDPIRPALVVPLFLLYDYSFRPTGSSLDDALIRAADNGVVCADEYLLHPDPFPSRQSWCAALVERTERRLAQLPASAATILVSHFPLRYDLVALPHMPDFSLWCGTARSHDWHRRYRATLVVSGHLHTPGTQWRDDVRFEEVSLGYPREWQRRDTKLGPRIVMPEPARLEGG
ncbi:MAG: metallophosphoesterase family protein [Actinomycetota bacterium]